MNKPYPHEWSVISDALFPSLDVALRTGRHISSEAGELFSFLSGNFEALSQFYLRYHLALIQAPESFFYLRPDPESLIPRALLQPLDMLVGKVLCLLYLSPDKLKSEGLFSLETVREELFLLIDPLRLFRLVHPRSSGSEVDQQKFKEKLRSSLARMRRLGMIAFNKPERLNDEAPSDPPFRITESVFRFSADLREGLDSQEAQRRLISLGEGVHLSKAPDLPQKAPINSESDSDPGAWDPLEGGELDFTHPSMLDKAIHRDTATEHE